MSNISLRRAANQSNTIVDLNNYLREVCAANLLSEIRVIGSGGLTVEID